MAEYIVLRNLAVDSKRAPGQAESKNWDWSAGPFEARGIGADDRGVGIVTAP